MGRAIGGVVVGYVVMAGLVFVTFSLAYLAMGADRAFQPGKYEPTNLWLVASFVLGLLAAVVGGLVCAAIAKGGKAPTVLAGVVLVLGLLFAIPVITASLADQAKVRESTVSNMEAMTIAVHPIWVALLNPFIGAAGTLWGASFIRRKPICQEVS